MTDTPETNAVNTQGVGYAQRFYAMKTHARKLERERDEARERADTMFVKHAEILDQAKRERDEMKEALEYILGIGLTVKTTERAKRALGIHGQNDKVSDRPS